MATTVIAGVVGLGTIYLPFVADRDKIRGLSEEQDPSGMSVLPPSQQQQEFERQMMHAQQEQAQQTKKPSMWGAIGGSGK